nr:hypothetical protein [Tanacetum cinerariifolium]
QKLLKDLKELAEYDQSTRTDRPIFLNDNEYHPVQNRESPENSSEENVVSKTNQEPPQDSDIHQLIKECSIEVPEEQKRDMEKTMLDLVKLCHHKQFLCIHNDVDNLIKSALDSKLLSINSISSQRLDKKESSISLNTSQISSIHVVTPILSTKEPENSLSMGYEHLCITPETKSDKVTKSNAKNFLPIPSEYEVTSEDKKECDELVCDTFFDSKINDDILVYDDDFEDIEYVEASPPDPEIVSIEEENSVEEENVVQREEEEVDLEDISQVQDVVLREKLFSITRLISNIESLNDNSTPDCVFDSFDGNTTHANYSLPGYDSFCFEIEPDQERLINLVESDIPDNSSNDLLLEEVNLFLSNNSIPSGIKNVFDDPEGDIHFLEELLIDDSILSHELSDANFKDNPSISRPPPEPPDDNFDLEPEVILAVMEDIDEPDEHFNLRGEIFVSTNNEDVDYFPFMFVIRIFLPYLILPEISPLFLFVESEDTIFDPGISK